MTQPCDNCGQPSATPTCDKGRRLHSRKVSLRRPRSDQNTAEDFSRRWVADDQGCWIWQGSLSTTGYGRFGWDGRQQYAHRVSFEISNGRPPVGQVDHTCRVRTCVNPAHLREVDAKGNLENHGGAKSTSASGIRGVWLDRRTQRWVVQVTHNRQRFWGGSYATPAEAGAAATALRNQLHTFNDRDRSAA